MRVRATHILGLLLTFLLFAACEKETLNVVGDNNPPDDPTVSYEQRDRYVERVYITLLGRKPDSSEHNSARSIIDQDPRDEALRVQWLNGVVTDYAVSAKRWDDIRSELLENVDTTEINRTIINLQILLAGAPPNQRFIFQEEIDRMRRIQYVTDSLNLEVYDNRQTHIYSVDNLIYDDINMGTENFVVSVFDHFLYRYPTLHELDASTSMVEGFRDVLFLQGGEGKEDFLEIFFSSDAYAEGQVRYLYLNYLFREPQTTELQAERIRYQQDYDFKAMQVRILSTDEYFFQ